MDQGRGHNRRKKVGQIYLRGQRPQDEKAVLRGAFPSPDRRGRFRRPHSEDRRSAGENREITLHHSSFLTRRWYGSCTKIKAWREVSRFEDSFPEEEVMSSAPPPAPYPGQPGAPPVMPVAQPAVPVVQP